LAAGCGSLPRREAALPELPQPAMEKSSPPIRDQVQKAYEEAKAKPRDAGANGRLGMVLQAYEQHELAATCYRRARHFEPRSFQWTYLLGTAQAATGRYTEAAATLHEAQRLDSKYAPARLKRGESLLAASEIEAGGAILEALARENPDWAEAHYSLGRVRSAQGDHAAAAGHYRRACELFERYGAARYALAGAYRALGETAKAQEQLTLHQKYSLDAPPEQDPLLAAVKALNAGGLRSLKKGISLEAAGRLEESAAEHERALEIDPRLVQAHINLISLYGRLGQADQADRHYRKAVEMNPHLADSHYNFGVLLHGRQKYREAGEAFGKALEASPAYPEAHNNLGYVREREGRFEEALAHYRAAIENKPNYRLAHFHLGRLLLHRGRTAEALEHLRQTLSPEDESTPGFMYGLGAAYARAGDRQNALRYLKEARGRAEALGQSGLLASIERDLRALR